MARPYFLSIWCDGACPNNGRGSKVGGWGVYTPRHPDRDLIEQNGPVSCRPGEDQTTSNNKAELAAMIVSLRTAAKIRDEWMYNDRARLICYISTDSAYVKGCLDEWFYKWQSNGWRNTKGLPVKNRELIEAALDLRDDLESRKSTVHILKIPRAENQEADELAKDACQGLFV